ncbi:MAG: LpqB family beta-propeller domain-containing protein [Chloroflexota bacterium]|nr:LpqB family beta-propeller domain-containing protein [Chloroflexota bacterium]
MLTRTYRIADKCGVVLFKSSAVLFELILEAVAFLWGGVLALLRVGARIVWFVLRPIIALFAGLFALVFGGARRTAKAAVRGGSTAMARRAARIEIDSTVLEDPLKGQNRSLSGLIVVLLAVLVGVVLWATGQTRGTGETPLAVGIAAANASDPNALFAVTVTSALIPTAQPSATALPALLNVRGAIVYAARESGQTDLFAVPIGSRATIRLSNDPADDRDPAWSPDGRQIAFASRRDGNWELYLFDVAGDSTRRLTTDLAYQGAPSWSSDGQYLVYEGYIGGDLGLYVLRTEGDPTPIAVPGAANSSAPDYAPSWSPDGRRIAFVSLRDGNQDVYVYSLDDQSIVNLTNTPERAEDHPAWSPDGAWIAYSALDIGQEKLFVSAVDDPNTSTQVINLGRAPAWSSDGATLAGVIDSIDGAQIVVNPFTSSGTAAVLPAPARTLHLSWTGQPLPSAVIEGGGVPPAFAEPLYIEAVEQRTGDPAYRLNTLSGVQVEQALLNDQVNDSYIALREAVNTQVGIDVLGRIDDAFWQIDRPPEPGVPRQGNWLLTGRAFALMRSGIFGFPPPLEIVREDIGVETYWRVYARVSEDAQSGQLGEPLRTLPWDFAARTSGDVVAYDQGGRLKTEIPTGYYVDLTAIGVEYGWMRAPAGRDWRANAETINYWLFEKRDGISWFAAMRELYTEAQMGGFVPTATRAVGATSIPAPTLEIRPSIVPVTVAPVVATDAPLEIAPTDAAPVTPLGELAG